MVDDKSLLQRVVSGTLNMDLYSYDPAAGLSGLIPKDDPVWAKKRSTWDWGQGVAWTGLIEANKLIHEPRIHKSLIEFVLCRYCALSRCSRLQFGARHSYTAMGTRTGTTFLQERLNYG